jgi:hypothetical protein
VTALIGGLTPAEHFHQHGSLPAKEIERLLDEQARVIAVLQAWSELEYELEALVEDGLIDGFNQTIARFKSLTSGFPQ